MDRIAKYYKVVEWPDAEGYFVTARNKEGKWGAPSSMEKVFDTEDEVIDVFVKGRKITLELHVRYNEPYFKWLDDEIDKGLKSEEGNDDA